MTKGQLQDVAGALASLPAVPYSYSYEGQMHPDRSGYVDYHIRSICGGPTKETSTEKHHCIGAVLAKDEKTASSLALLIEAAPLLLKEVTRLREVLTRLADPIAVEAAIENAYLLGGDGVHCAYKSVQATARNALDGVE